MVNSKVFNVVFEIEEIEKYLDALVSDEEKIKYLVYLRNEYIILCYNLKDRAIRNDLNKDIISKYEFIPYSVNSDFEQTHISRSGFVLLLRHIDRELIPFVRAELLKLDKDIKEDLGIMTKDYNIFNFDLNKVLDYSNDLKEYKLIYLEAILKDYEQYLNDVCNIQFGMNYYREYSRSEFVKGVKDRINAWKKYPDILFPKLEKDEVNADVTEIFKIEPTLFEFDIIRIKKHTKELSKPEEQIKYLEFVKKEVVQNPDILGKEKQDSIIKILSGDIYYYKKILDMNNNTQENPKTISSATVPESIKLHWQDDNSLVPYLFKLLHNEGFISGGDFADRKQFIEQSIFKNNGEVFTAKEVASYESGMKVNINEVPKKAEKVQRAISKLKDRSNELKEKAKKPKK